MVGWYEAHFCVIRFSKASKSEFYLVRVPRKCCRAYFFFFPVVLKSPHGSRSQVEPEEPKSTPNNVSPKF